MSFSELWIVSPLRFNGVDRGAATDESYVQKGG
jgi:hypothetical protein